MDRNRDATNDYEWAERRPLPGGVDRNRTYAEAEDVLGQVAPFPGAWIETTYAEAEDVLGQVAPFPGAWIET